jgi:hypothetical protein
MATERLFAPVMEESDSDDDIDAQTVRKKSKTTGPNGTLNNSASRPVDSEDDIVSPPPKVTGVY